MRNAEAIKRRLEAAKHIGDQKEALNTLADITFDIGISACEERKKLQAEIDNLRKIIVGNGDFEHSLLARVGGMEKCVDSMGETLEEIKRALLGGIGDDKNYTGGIMGKINDLKDFKSNVTKIMWAIILAALAQIVTTILGLI